MFTFSCVCILWTDVNRDSVSQAKRTTYCMIPDSWQTYARAKPAEAAGIIPRRPTIIPAVMPIPQTIFSNLKIFSLFVAYLTT